jgi:hypothetical protein
MFKCKGVILFSLVLFSAVIFAKNLEFEKQCGKYKYIINIEDVAQWQEIIKHYYQEGDIPKKLFHQSDSGTYVRTSCIKDKNNEDVFIFSEECGGSGCVDSVYGLFNPKQKKMLLKPADWPKGNEEELINLVGNSNFLNLTHRPSRFKDNEFCCFNELLEYQATLSADTRPY